MKLQIEPPDFIHCPFCGKRLDEREEEGKARKYCGDCKWTYYPHVAASSCAAIVNNGKILLVKRNREPYKGTWMFPAGFVDFGEHPADTVVREVKEEVGLEVASLRLLDVIQVDDDPRSMGQFGFFYRVTTKDNDVKNNDNGENSEIGWFDLDDLPLIGWHSHKKIVEDYIKKPNRAVNK